MVRVDVEGPPLPRFEKTQGQPRTGEDRQQGVRRPARHGARSRRRMAGSGRNLGTLSGHARPIGADERGELGVQRAAIRRHAPRDAPTQDRLRAHPRRLRSEAPPGMAARTLARQPETRPRGPAIARQGHRRPSGTGARQTHRDRGARRHVPSVGRPAFDPEERPSPLQGRTVRGYGIHGTRCHRIPGRDRIRRPRRPARMAVQG